MFSAGDARDHVEKLKRVLQRLRKQQLFVKLGKCAFGRGRDDFLGDIRDGARAIEPAKAQEIRAFTAPTTVVQVRYII